MKEILLPFDLEDCSDALKEALETAFSMAANTNAEFVTPELLLYCITQQKAFMEYCDSANVDLQLMRQDTLEYLEGLCLPYETDIVLSHTLKRIFEFLKVQSAKYSSQMGILDVIFVISRFTDTYASYLIRTYMGESEDLWLFPLTILYHSDSSILDIVKTEELDEALKMPDAAEEEAQEEELTEEQMLSRLVSHAGRLFNSINELKKMGATITPGSSIEVGSSGSNINNVANEHGSPNQRKKQPWEMLVTNVSETYHHRNTLIGREKELDTTIQILCQKDKNNVLHIGEAGVGKTAIVYGLARKIAEGDVPAALRDCTIYMLDMSTLVAGASYHGEFEKRLQDVMQGMYEMEDCICYIDEIHNIMGAGGAGNGSMDAANMLKPYLEDGTIRFIGSTTYQEYNRHMANSKGIVRRFQQVDILEPSVEETMKILEGIVPDYAVHHRVKYDNDAIAYAVEQSDRLISDRFLPDKAISIIDRAGSYRQTHPLRNKKGEVMSPGRQKVDKVLIANILSEVCKVNAKALAEESNESLASLSERIGSEIYGQQEAVDKVVRAVKMSKAGLTLGDKPLASLLFVGPTGVGKTEVCKVLAQELGIELVRFDMSEYTEKHTVAKLIGSPAGYVGYDDGGLLTDAIRKSPNCVLLLDEIEKAHSDIYNILLQVMDYARLTDNKGNKVDFKNVILIMTSNAGAQYAGQAAIGFSGGMSKGHAMMQTVKKTFKPEFLNRLSSTVVFNDMDETMASMILDKKLRQLSLLLEKKNVSLELSEDARDILLREGFTRQYGAREMDRVIQNHLTPLLMDEILFGNLKDGGNARIAVKDGALTL